MVEEKIRNAERMRERKTRDPEMTFNGLYYFRLLALGLVVYQHIASNLVARVSLSTDLICFNSGQTGVAFFCILSGYLSGLTFRKNKNWLDEKAFQNFPQLLDSSIDRASWQCPFGL